MNEQEVKQLIDKYNQGLASAEEKAWLEHWYAAEALKQNFPETDIPDEATKARLWQGTLRRAGLNQPAPLVRRLWPRIAAAASVIAILSAGSYFLLQQKAATQHIARLEHNAIAPGSNKAILTLASGQQIILTGAKNGQIARQGLTVVQKKADGQLVYQAAPAAATAVYNTMTTPRGGQYWVTLPDGSRVLLNAASSLTYPVAFSGKERKVTLTGEAYFEVVHNDKMPFRVATKNQVVEDIGTHFNINAYEDEPVVRTTLLEGGIKVSHGAKAAILQPGQQAVLQADELQVSAGDTEAAVAWKNGYFMFDSENIQSIMRKLARWYDVTVSYQGEIPRQAYSGDMSRFTDVSQVLEMLEKTHTVHFKIEERRIIVTK